MSSTAAASTASAPLPTSTTVCTSNLYNTPVQDRACAMPYGGNHTDVMKACCRDADVVAYYDDCGLYCLALGQSVADLEDCLFDHGAGWTDVFCRDNGNVNATATATGNSPPDASAQASIVVSGGGGSGKDGEGSATGTRSGGGGGSSSSTSSTSSPNAAAAGVYAPAGASTVGLTLGALLLSAATFGALQI